MSEPNMWWLLSLKTLLSLFTFLAPTFSAYNSGFILSTLYTFQAVACDGQTIKISCPRGSTISVQKAEYGRQVSSDKMCPYRRHHPFSFAQEDTNCMSDSSDEVLLDRCHEKKQCQITATTAVFGADPCPHTGKYLTVKYKCRPNEFRHKIACEGDRLHLRCVKGMRLAIYSAAFGRTPGESTECPGYPSVVADCRSSNSLKEVLKRCHGRRHCNVHASPKVFGSPCEPETMQYLKVIYSCVPKQILKELKRQRNGKNNIQNEDTRYSEYRPNRLGNIERPGTDGAPRYDPKVSTYLYENFLTVATQSPTVREAPTKPVGGDEREQEDSVRVNSTSDNSNTNHAVFCNYTVVPPQPEKEIGFMADWVSSIHFLQKNQEKAILYLIVGGCTGLICVLFLVIGRLIYTRRSKRSQKLDVSEHVATTTPARTENGGMDASETIDMLQFNTHPGTLRSMNTIDRRFNTSLYNS